MRRRILPLALVPTLFLSLLFLMPGAAAHAQGPTGPNFSNVADILQGRRQLFPSDDLIIGTNDSYEGSITTTILQTNNDAISAQFPSTIKTNPDRNFFLTASARMFDLPWDVVVTVLPGQTVLNDHNANINQAFSNNLNAFPPQGGITANDFTGDGYADLAFVNYPNATSLSLIVMTAVDVHDRSTGFLYSTPLTLPNDQQAFDGAITSIASGDFNGDGESEIAVAYQNNGMFVAIFNTQVTTNAQGNVTGITLKQIGSTSAGAYPSEALVLNAGRYNDSPTPSLALLYQLPNGHGALQTIKVTSTSNPNQLDLTIANSLPIGQHELEYFNATSGYLDFFGSDEQMVVNQEDITGARLQVITFDDVLNPAVASTLPIPDEFSGYFYGMALGNFDQPNTDNNPVTLELAVVSLEVTESCLGAETPFVQLYHIDANTFALAPSYKSQLDGCVGAFTSAPLVSGDTQGRSLLLGPPTKITATKHRQTQVVLDAPPMHVDYVTPANDSRPVVLNMSAVPHGFYSSYKTSVSNQTQSSRQSTTSYTNGVKGSGTYGFKIDIPFVGSVSGKVTASAGWMHQKFIGHQYGQYSSTQFDASTTTGFDDQVWFTEEDHNIYVYPVIGQTACPSDIPNCNAAQRVPLVVMFSGPSNQSQSSVGGSALEWYQPVHEIGNIFSYPWNFQQLQAVEQNIALLTSQDPTSFQTDTSTTQVEASWSGQNSSSVTSGSVTNISWGASTSMTEKGSIGGLYGKQKFSYNGSKSINTLNTQTTKVGESTGIGIEKPASFPNPSEYRYTVAPYIFGNNPVSGTVQTINLGTTVQTSGVLHAAFTADPTTSTAGAWWTGDKYPYPDVALAHPNRWSVSVYTPSSPQPNCIPISTMVRNNDCITFNSPEPDIWTSEFYWMKGLLITPANANGEGPQIDRATAGDQIQLQARVYNNSLTDMPQGSQIVVQFYGQVWNPTTKQPTGDAFLINTVNASPLPGFNSTSTNGMTPNWSLVSTTLDTTNYANQNLGFWVVVFITQNDLLVQEMPAHGLTSIPSNLAQAMKVLEPYSNNIGFYKQLFYVAPPSSTAAVDARKAKLKISQVTASAQTVLLGDKVSVSGLVSSNKRTEGLSILFKDRIQESKARVFDVEQIAHIDGNSTHLVKTVYHAKTCGEHTLVLKGLGISLKGNTQINVTINPLAYTRRIRRVIATADLEAEKLKALLDEAIQSFQRGDTQAGLETLEHVQRRVQSKRGDTIPTEQADTILSILGEIFECVK